MPLRYLRSINVCLFALYCQTTFAVVDVTLNFNTSGNQALKIVTLRLDNGVELDNNNQNRRAGVLLDPGQHTVKATGSDGRNYEGTFVVPEGDGPHNINVNMIQFVTLTSTSGNNFEDALRLSQYGYLARNYIYYDWTVDLSQFNSNQGATDAFGNIPQWTMGGSFKDLFGALGQETKPTSSTQQTDNFQIGAHVDYKHFQRYDSFGVTLGVAYNYGKPTLGTYQNEWNQVFGTNYNFGGYAQYPWAWETTKTIVSEKPIVDRPWGFSVPSGTTTTPFFQRALDHLAKNETPFNVSLAPKFFRENWDYKGQLTDSQITVPRGMAIKGSAVHPRFNARFVAWGPSPEEQFWDLEKSGWLDNLSDDDFYFLRDIMTRGPLNSSPYQIRYKLGENASALTWGRRYTANSYPPNYNFSSLFKTFNTRFGGRINYAIPRHISARHPETIGKAKDAKAVLAKLPNDGFFHSSSSWGQKFDDQWGLKKIGFKASDRKGKGSLWPRKAYPIIVAVVDTGIDFGHPDLHGSLWANVKDKPNDMKDDDKNGHVDDFMGWNFVGNNNNTRDNNGHGTFVAGIIAATVDNGIGISGINPWARIMPVKVANYAGDSNSVDVAQGIAYAAHMGAKVINVSISGRKLSKIEQIAVREATKAGALVVVAAGNESKDVKDISPAGLDGVITVAATDHNNKRANYSNWGAMVDIAAPGSDILSLRAIQTDLMQYEDKDYKKGNNIIGTYRHYYHLSGTSFSAPYVAGVASLLFSLNPKLTAEQVKRMILQSAKDINEPGIDQFTGYGLLDAAAAIQADPAFFIETRISGVSVVQKDGKPYVRVTGTANANRLKRTWIELGKGAKPSEWKKVSGNINKGVKDGAIDDLNAGNFSGSTNWIIRVITEHKNGKKREARFALKLG